MSEKNYDIKKELSGSKVYELETLQEICSLQIEKYQVFEIFKDFQI